MNHKYTLFKQNDRYILFIGTWLVVSKIPNAQHLKHGWMSENEFDYIKIRKLARFKWVESSGCYVHSYRDDDNPITVSQLYLYEKRKNLYIGKLRPAIFSWDVAALKAAEKEAIRKGEKKC